MDAFEDDEVSINTLLHSKYKPEFPNEENFSDEYEELDGDKFSMSSRFSFMNHWRKFSKQRRSTQITLGTDCDNRWSMRRSTVASTLVGVPHATMKVKKPTVLAELPHLVEIVRVDGAQDLPSSICSEVYNLHFDIYYDYVT